MRRVSEFLTPPQVAERLGVKPERVRSWIAGGQLRAINLGDASRPRWRIQESGLSEFLAGRSNSPTPEKVKSHTRRRRSAGSDHVIEFFK